MQEAFHDNLASERAGQRGVLAGGQQGERKQRAGKAGSQDGTKEFVGVGDFGDVVQAAGVKRGGAEDADGNVKHFAVAQDFGAGEEADSGFAPERVREKDFVTETKGDGGNEGDHEGFHETEAAALQSEDEKNVERGDENSGEKRQAEEQLQRDGGAENFRQVASGDGNFADNPQKEGSAARVVFAASLGKIAAGGNAKFCRQSLQKHRH